jgi:hypothetical protein
MPPNERVRLACQRVLCQRRRLRPYPLPPLPPELAVPVRQVQLTTRPRAGKGSCLGMAYGCPNFNLEL